MKRFPLVLCLLLVLLGLPVGAQDLATLDERVKRLNGYVQDLQEENANQKKQIEALGRELATVREQQQNQPAAATASHDDLRDLAKKVQEIEDKRKADRVFLEREFERLAKLASAKPNIPKNTQSPRAADGPTDLPKEALEHVIASGDTLSTIAVAYSKERGVKVTTELILRANPGLKAEKLIVGKKILIPIPDR